MPLFLNKIMKIRNNKELLLIWNLNENIIKVELAGYLVFVPTGNTFFFHSSSCIVCKYVGNDNKG